MEVAKWAKDEDARGTRVDLHRAAEAATWRMLQWARANGCSVGREDLRLCRERRPPGGAAVGARERLPVGRADLRRSRGGGHLEVLQWARANGCSVGRDTCAGAANGGHLEVLQWARANGAPWDEWTCAGAAEGGHLEVLQWARANGCSVGRVDLQPVPRKAATWRCCSGRARTAAPWDERTCAGAAGGGHLEVLQWARANGCSVGREDLRRAAGGGHLEVLQWARANGAPWDD